MERCRRCGEEFKPRDETQEYCDVCEDLIAEQGEYPKININKMQPTTSKYFGFGEALNHLRQGVKVAREGWNGIGMYVELQVPTDLSKMKRPYIFMSPIDGNLVPWVASQTDLLAEDWYVVITE